MAAQTPRKTAAGSGDKSKSRSAGRGSSGTKKKAAGAKAAPRKTSRSRKKKGGQKNPGLLARSRPYLMGLTLGLLVGVLGALAVFYAPRIPWSPEAEPAPAVQESQRSGPVQYEENPRLEAAAKRVDQALSSAFSSAEVPEEDVHFLLVTPRRDNGSEWLHSVIEVDLPPRTAPAKMAALIKDEIAGRKIDPAPVVRFRRRDGVDWVEVSLSGHPTHTLHLLPRASARRPAPKETSAAPEPPRPAPPAESSSRPRAAIIIDDFGVDARQVRCFSELPVAVSVLPFLDQSRESARLAHDAGRPVLVHLPMQPSGHPASKAGPGALLVDMDREGIRRLTAEAIDAVPYACGVNNHMGSKFTEDARRVAWALEVVRDRGLIFVDSRTTARSQAYRAAVELDLDCAQRAVFLDNVLDRRAIAMQIRKLAAVARQNGSAVGIGHAHAITCQTLKAEYNYIKSKIDLVDIRDLVRK
jgi:hypothetical protein